MDGNSQLNCGKTGGYAEQLPEGSLSNSSIQTSGSTNLGLRSRDDEISDHGEETHLPQPHHELK